MPNEQEEFHAQRLREQQAMEKNKSEASRLIGMARSAYLVVVLPDGNIGVRLFHAGYADLKAMMAESEDAFHEAITKIKRAPTDKIF